MLVAYGDFGWTDAGVFGFFVGVVGGECDCCLECWEGGGGLVFVFKGRGGVGGWREGNRYRFGFHVRSRAHLWWFQFCRGLRGTSSLGLLTRYLFFLQIVS
jgi:hypothetical protein